jgi:CRP/FNR family cyclic AMP-dependent transcriptional regulator
MLTAGSVKAFVKNPQGRQVQVHEFKEGAFFGEISILTGKPRSATLIASTRCELLELDRPTLDSIVQSHPHVLDVMQDFARQRTARPA